MGQFIFWKSLIPIQNSKSGFGDVAFFFKISTTIPLPVTLQTKL